MALFYIFPPQNELDTIQVETEFKDSVISELEETLRTEANKITDLERKNQVSHCYIDVPRVAQSIHSLLSCVPRVAQSIHSLLSCVPRVTHSIHNLLSCVPRVAVYCLVFPG